MMRPYSMFGNMDVAAGLAHVISDTWENHLDRKKDRFKVEVTEKHYAPEEISVSTANGYIVIEGKHEMKRDKQGYISRQFTRRFALPKSFIPDPESLEFKLSSKGVLKVTAQRKVPVAVQGEGSTPVTQTEPVRNEEKDQAESDK